jgi:hypothetical protein
VVRKEGRQRGKESKREGGKVENRVRKREGG